MFLGLNVILSIIIRIIGAYYTEFRKSIARLLISALYFNYPTFKTEKWQSKWNQYLIYVIHFFLNSLTQQPKKWFIFCWIQQNGEEERKLRLWFIFRWKATQLWWQPEALQNFLQTECSISCKDFALVFWRYIHRCFLFHSTYSARTTHKHIDILSWAREQIDKYHFVCSKIINVYEVP